MTTTMEKLTGVLIRGREVRKLLGISEEVLEAMVVNGKLNRTRLYDGGHWWYYRTEVEATVEGGQGGKGARVQGGVR